MSRLILTTEAAKILGVSTSTVRRLAKSGKIKSWKLGVGSHGFKLEDVLAYKEKACKK